MDLTPEQVRASYGYRLPPTPSWLLPAFARPGTTEPTNHAGTRPDDTHARISILEGQVGLRDKDILTLARDLDNTRKSLDEATRLIQCLTDMLITRNLLIADIKASQPRIRQRLTVLERKLRGSR